MAYRRRRRGKRVATLSKRFKQYMDAFLFLALVPFVGGILGWLTATLPERNLTIGTVTISSSLFLGLITFAVPVALLIIALAKLRVRI